MSDFDPNAIALKLFDRLRRNGFNVGVSEYIAALDAIRGGMGTASLDELKLVLRSLWCHSRDEQGQFERFWESATASLPKPPAERPEKPLPEPAAPNRPESPEALPPPPQSEKPLPEPTVKELAPLPIRTPYTPAEIADLPELQDYHPLSRRSMSYSWRYLRRPMADGPADVLDVRATVEQAARSGFFLAPVYRRREVNHAQLVLLIDQAGSMVPFHRFTRDLVETAENTKTLQEDQVSVYYFHNVPDQYLYRDPHLMEPVELNLALAEASCDINTSLLIVSDGGAARGYRRMERVRATTQFLSRLRQYTQLISWLNPMPFDRWEGSSAAIIAYLVPMEQMDGDGLSNAIDIMRGQVWIA